MIRNVCVYEDPTMFGTHGITAAVKQQSKALRFVDVNVKEKPSEPYEVFHANWCSPISLIRLKQAQRKGKLGIVFAHSGKDVIGGFTFSRLLSKPFIRWLVTFYRSGDLVITPSSYTRDMIIDFGVSEEKIRVVSNGVDYEKVKFSRKKRKKYRDKFDLNKPTVIGVGQVIARKAISLFVQAAHLLPQYEFIWFGSRMNKLMMYDRDMDQAIANAPANMTFTGYVEDIQAAYSSGDLFFFPSYEENQGIVLLEAATRGIPIVTRDLPVYQGWLKDGDNCLKGNSLDQFVKLIEKGIENEDLRESLVSNAKEMADQHRLENIGERYLQIYERHLR